MEEAAAGAGEEEVYCAVGKANLRWVLANFSGRRLVLAHVHRPPHRINTMGAWVPVSQVGAALVAACRKWEEDEASDALDQLSRICKAHRVLARKLIVSGDDVAGALAQLVADHGVSELVMGATADRAYSRLISRGEPSMASTSPRPTASDCSTLASSSHHHGDGAAEPVGAHDSPTPSHHGSGDAREMDDALAEKLKDEETRPQPEADVQSMPVTDGDQGVSVLRFGLPELEHSSRKQRTVGRPLIPIHRPGIRFGNEVGFGTIRRRFGVPAACSSIQVPGSDSQNARHNLLTPSFLFSRTPRSSSSPLIARNPLTARNADRQAVVVPQELPRAGGSLEGRLTQERDGTPPLPWRARCAVAYQVLSVLAFLLSLVSEDGDVRPTNVLLLDDDEEVHRPSGSKLAGVGMRGLVSEQQQAGREALAYVDPRYVAMGEPTPQWDVHGLGLVLLRLVTGMTARAAKKAAREAAAGGRRAWSEVVDASAGGWPSKLATEVALLGLRCCAVSDGRELCRPAGELLEEALTVLKAAMDAAPGRAWSSSLLSSSETEASHGGGSECQRQQQVHKVVDAAAQ
ncbi:hypothetical protein VPH35_132949 [Triticum aestivum]